MKNLNAQLLKSTVAAGFGAGIALIFHATSAEKPSNNQTYAQSIGQVAVSTELSSTHPWNDADKVRLWALPAGALVVFPALEAAMNVAMRRPEEAETRTSTARPAWTIPTPYTPPMRKA